MRKAERSHTLLFLFVPVSQPKGRTKESIVLSFPLVSFRLKGQANGEQVIPRIMIEMRFAVLCNHVDFDLFKHLNHSF